MKNNFLKFLSAAAMLSFGLTGNTQCLNTNGDMETYSSPITSGNPWINNDLTNWNVSHGTPSIGTTPSTNIWMWSYSGYGEGVYTEYNFVAGETYELCYDVWRDGTSNPTSEFRVELATGLSPWFGGNFTPLPVPATQQSLTTQPWTGTGTWVTITETFTASSNFDQLWFYPFLAGAPSPWQAACRVDNVCVKEVVTDPCDFKPEFKVTSPDECTLGFDNVTSIPTGLTVLSTTWDFGDGSTASGDYVEHYYATGGVYEVCMTVWVINEDGKCCQLKFCERVEARDCNPCEWIEKIDISAVGSNPFTFTPTGIPSGMVSILGFHWDFGDGTTATGSTVNHTYAAGGTYEVCVTVYYYDARTESCCSAKACIRVEAKDVDIIKPKAAIQLEEGLDMETVDNKLAPVQNVIVAPNPNNGTFSVLTKDGAQINTVSVYNQAGQLVYSSQNVENTSRLDLAITNLEKGLYLIVVNEADEMNRQFSKLTVQ